MRDYMIITLGLLERYSSIYLLERNGQDTSDRATAHPFAIENGGKNALKFVLHDTKYMLL